MLKNTRVYSYITVALAAVLGASAANAQTFKLPKGTVKVDVPEQWQDVSDLFGMPLMFLGPEKEGGRPVLSVTPTGKKGLHFDSDELAKNEQEYKDGREAWLKKYSGTSVSYTPYKTEKWNGIQEAHVIGYRYKINDTEFAENSYYVVCKDQLFHLKTLIRASHEKDYASTLDQTVKSFTCE